jgi:hypothetical protein
MNLYYDRGEPDYSMVGKTIVVFVVCFMALWLISVAIDSLNCYVTCIEPYPYSRIVCAFAPLSGLAIIAIAFLVSNEIWFGKKEAS